MPGRREGGVKKKSRLNIVQTIGHNKNKNNSYNGNKEDMQVPSWGT